MNEYLIRQMSWKAYDALNRGNVEEAKKLLEHLGRVLNGQEG